MTSDPIIDVASGPGFLVNVASAVGAALLAAAKVFVAHTIVFGILLVLIVYWATAGAGMWRGVAAASASLAMHAAIAAFVLFLSTLIAAGAAVQRFGVGRSVLRAAAQRAEAMNPQLKESNDFGAFTRAIADAFEALACEEIQPPVGRLVRSGRFAKRIGRRIIRVVGKVVLKQVELMPRADGVVPYETLDEWLGARIDGYVADTIRQPAIRWVGALLVLQVVLTVGIVFVAR